MEFENLLLKTTDAMTLRGFTTSTKKTYLLNISKYLKFVSQKGVKPDEISAKAYILRLHNLNLSNNSIRLKAACILYLLKEVMKLKVTYLDVPKPKKHSTLPKVLSKSEIKLLLSNITNFKHKFMIEFLYSTGLRLSEFIEEIFKRKFLTNYVNKI
jgi:site-specific recombinase XerD